jgi:hypothetical protein
LKKPVAFSALASLLFAQTPSRSPGGENFEAIEERRWDDANLQIPVVAPTLGAIAPQLLLDDLSLVADCR